MRDIGVRPGRVRLLTEARALLELVATVLAEPLFRRLPPGDGHPVMVLPGFLASDASTIPLRLFLRARGYAPYGWGAGRNLGRPGQEDEVLLALQRIVHHHGRKVSLVGWSLGGVYAREIARLAPGRVRQVVSMGSPFTGNPRANHAWELYERLSGRTYDEIRQMAARIRRPPPVPSTAIFSRSDAITAWQCCVQPPGPRAENVEVESSHLGYGHNPLVLYVIADRLAQKEGAWRAFDPQGLPALFFRAKEEVSAGPPKPRRRRVPRPAPGDAVPSASAPR